MTQTIPFQVLNLIHWDLFGAWCLGFGAYPARVSLFHTEVFFPAASFFWPVSDPL